MTEKWEDESGSMMSRRSFLCGATALLAGAGDLTASQTAPLQTPDTTALKRAAQHSGKILGMFTVQYELLHDPTGSAVIANTFSMIADGNDLNPAMLVRWQVYLSRTRKGHDPIFTPWHALAALPEAEFTSRVEPLIGRFVGETNPSRTINPVVARALADQPPRSLAETARIYARLLGGVATAARALGLQHLVLDTGIDNKFCQRFYFRHGTLPLAVRFAMPLDLTP